MKKIFALLIAVLVAVPAVQAQSQKEILKEHKRERKVALNELNSKAPKAARKEAKRLKKEGWLVLPGALPMEKQLERSYIYEYQVDDDLMPKFYTVSAQSVGGNFNAANMQSIELAKNLIAGLVETDVTSLIESTVANEQMTREEAVSVSQTVAASKNLISKALSNLNPHVVMYREVNKNNVEVSVRVSYNRDTALETAKKVVKKELEKKGDDLHKKLDELMF